MARRRYYTIAEKKSFANGCRCGARNANKRSYRKRKSY